MPLWPWRNQEAMQPEAPHSVRVRFAGQRDPFADLLELTRYRHLLGELIRRDLKVRYKRSLLGYLWTMLNPLLMMLATTLVFSHVFRFSIDNYPIYVLSGYILWMFFAQGTLAATTVLLSSSALARNIYLPPALFPLAAVNAAAVHLLLSLLPLFLLVTLTGGRLDGALLSLPVGLGLAFLFTYGLALILAAASVFFHDIIHIYQVLLTVWMYITPIFFPIEIVPEEWSSILHLNPLLYLVRIFRDPIYAGTWPDPSGVGIAAACAFGTVMLGWWYFQRSRDAFSSYL
jgi:ABC-type polysaccharide/polyol phosphate export permease